MKLGDLIEVVNHWHIVGRELSIPAGATGVVVGKCINPYYFRVFVEDTVVDMFKDDIKQVAL
jgi:hypothetical protein